MGSKPSVCNADSSLIPRYRGGENLERLLRGTTMLLPVIDTQIISDESAALARRQVAERTCSMSGPCARDVISCPGFAPLLPQSRPTP